MVFLKPQRLRFDPVLANYVDLTMVAITLAVDAEINTHVQKVQIYI